MTPIRLIHCSYHKCLTVYFRRVMHGLFNRCLPWRGGYHHYNSHLQSFYEGFADHRVSSINNRCLDLDRLGEFRISRFVRDPRDLVVSGYFYHRRGAEPWVNIAPPTNEDWYFANGVIPQGLEARGGSFAQYLQVLPEEEGLLAELEFRRNHFESIVAVASQHPNILLQRYEEVVGQRGGGVRPVSTSTSSHASNGLWGDGWLADTRWHVAARSTLHVRNPRPGQWRDHFTPRVRKAFMSQHAICSSSSATRMIEHAP